MRMHDSQSGKTHIADEMLRKLVKQRNYVVVLVAGKPPRPLPSVLLRPPAPVVMFWPPKHPGKIQETGQ
jgi:hypothetical protein